MPLVSSAGVLLGSPTPRVGVVPEGNDHRGREAVEFAEHDLRINLLPWQRYVLDATCRTDWVDRWAYRTCLTLVARQNGKSLLAACRILAGLMLWGERLIIAAAQSRDISLEQFRTTIEIAEEADLPIKKIHRASGREELVLEAPDGREGRYKVVTASAGGGRGLSADCVVMDEVREFKSHDVWAALDRTRRAKQSSQLFAISTEGDEVSSVVLNSLQAQGREAAESGEQRGLMYCEWSAHPDRAPDDRQGWAESNPSLNVLVPEDTIASELRTDPPEVFEQETLCRKVVTARAWLPPTAWQGCTIGPDEPVPEGGAGAVVFSVDVAGDLTQAAIAAAWPRPDGLVNVELTDVFDGTGASASAETRLQALVSRWDPRALVVLAKSPGEALAGRVAAAGGIELVVVKPTDQERSARSFFEATINGRLRHPADPVLASHLAAAQRGQPGTFDPKGGNVGASAAVLAVWAVDRAPAKPRFEWAAY